MQNESTSMAMAYLANLAKFDPDQDSISRFSQKSHSHPPEINLNQSLSRLVLQPSQSGNDLEPDNETLLIIVTCWTPSGIQRLVEVESVEQGLFVQRMNPKPKRVTCSDCTYANVHVGIARCGAGVDSGIPAGGWWGTDSHLCSEFKEHQHD
jgi:hypothetical protein